MDRFLDDYSGKTSWIQHISITLVCLPMQHGFIWKPTYFESLLSSHSSFCPGQIPSIFSS